MKRDNKGRFQKRPSPVQLSDEQFILQVKNELYQLHMNPERIRKAYWLITADDKANVSVMRRVILAYAGN